MWNAIVADSFSSCQYRSLVRLEYVYIHIINIYIYTYSVYSAYKVCGRRTLHLFSGSLLACFLWFNELINIILTSHQLLNKPNFRHVCACVGVRMLTSYVLGEGWIQFLSSTTCCMQCVGTPLLPLWIMSRKWGSCNHVITAFRGKSINRFRLVSVSQWRAQQSARQV